MKKRFLFILIFELVFLLIAYLYLNKHLYFNFNNKNNNNQFVNKNIIYLKPSVYKMESIDNKKIIKNNDIYDLINNL